MSRIIKTSFADDGDDRTLGRLADALEQREPELRKVIGQPEEPDVTPTLDESDGGFVTPDRFFWKWMAVMAEKEYGKTQDQLDATGKSVRAAGGELGAVLRGGPGSGHFGHKGIPKHRGGSQPGDFHSAQGKKKPGTAHLTLDELMAAGKTEAREAKFPSSETTAKMLDDLQIEADAALDQFAGRAAMTALGAEGDSTSWFLRLAVPNNGYSLVEQAQMAFGDDATDEQVQEIGRASARHLALMSMYEYERITKGAGFSSKKQAAKAEAFYQKMKALAEDTKDVPGLAEASNYKPPADAKPLFRGLDSRQVELVTGWMSQRDSGMDSRFDTAEQLYDALSRSTSMPSIPRDIHDTLIDNLGKELVGGNKKAVAWFEENRGPATVSNVVHALNAADRYQWVPEDAPEELRAIADEINVGWTRTNAVPTSILTAEVAAELWGGEAPGRDTYDSEDLGELHSQTTRFLKGVDATDYYDQMDRTGGREAARKFLEYQYAQTQDFFRRIGLDPDKDTMRLYRGVRDEHEGESTFGKWNPGGAMREEPTTVKTYSLASWASGVEDALKFAVPVPEGEDAPEHDAETGELTEEEMDYEVPVPLHNGFVMVADVPLSKVVAIAHTGFPCWFESEFVVMGGEGIPNARVVPMQDLYQGETTPRYFEEELLAKGEEEYYKFVEDVGSGPEGLIRYIRGEAEEQLKPKVDEWLGEERRISGDVHSVERSLTLTRRLTLRGGPGSGHFDHAGRPGKVGGSQPSDFHSAESRGGRSSDLHSATEALKVPRTEKWKPVVGALETIDSVHGIDSVPLNLKVTLLSPTSMNGGHLRVERGPGHFAIKNMALRILPEGETPDGIPQHLEFTVAHEFGHLLDWSAFREIQRSSGDWGDYDKPVQGSRAVWYLGAESEGMYDVMKAIKLSKAYDALKVDTMPYRAWPGSKVKLVYDRDTMRYLREPEELFARAYAQYVAVRSGDERMLKGVKDYQDGAKAGHPPMAWEDKDFQPIAEAFDSMFGERNWR